MLKQVYADLMGRSNLDWLHSLFHFSFAEYYNPNNMHFGVLRVLNDDIINAHEGFDTHQHQNMEIITYIIDGELTHKDSLGHTQVSKRGEAQHMSAGASILHSEYNHGDDPLRLLQIWILPNEKNLVPSYTPYTFNWEDRHNKALLMVSGTNEDAPLFINQDVNIYSLFLDKDKEYHVEVETNRQCYLVQIEGESYASGQHLKEKDALESLEEDFDLHAIKDSHYLWIEMPLYKA